jgi:hypothetical protein
MPSKTSKWSFLSFDWNVQDDGKKGEAASNKNSPVATKAVTDSSTLKLKHFDGLVEGYNTILSLLTTNIDTHPLLLVFLSHCPLHNIITSNIHHSESIHVNHIITLGGSLVQDIQFPKDPQEKNIM